VVPDETIAGMGDIVFFAVCTLVLPVLINKSTEGERFDFLKPYLREAWTVVFVFLSTYYLTKPEAMEFLMKAHSSLPGYKGYFLAAVLGATVLCVYWWFAGLTVSPTGQKANTETSLTAKSSKEHTNANQVAPVPETMRTNARTVAPDSPVTVGSPIANIPEPSNRPWLSLEARPNSGLTYGADGGVTISVIFGWRNTGQSPAQEVWFVAKMFAYAPQKNPIEERDRFCMDTSMNSIRKKLGKTIFPEYGDGVNYTFGLGKTDIDTAMANFDGHLLPLAIMGCVAYTVPGSAKPHYTGIFLDIHKQSPQVSQGVAPMPYEDVPQGSLMLVASPLGGGVTSK
jgi:hypothetical protein